MCKLFMRTSLPVTSVTATWLRIPDNILGASHGGTCSKSCTLNFSRRAIKRFVIVAPRIAHKQKPGQFVILRIYEQGERIPITIESSDPEHGTISIVVQSIGKTTICSIR